MVLIKVRYPGNWLNEQKAIYKKLRKFDLNEETGAFPFGCWLAFTEFVRR